LAGGNWAYSRVTQTAINAIAASSQGQDAINQQYVQKAQNKNGQPNLQTMGKTTGDFMIATVFALALGAVIGVGTLVIVAYTLAYLQDLD
jgi:hypothetical protein